VPEKNQSQALFKLKLDTISASSLEHVPEDPDDCTTQEQLEILRQREVVRSFAQDTGERKKYAKRIFGLTCIWVVGIYALLLLQGFGYKGFHLSDQILLAAIGSTTANIIGVFLIVTRYFFPKK
jgi:hypothetical protein